MKLKFLLIIISVVVALTVFGDPQRSHSFNNYAVMEDILSTTFIGDELGSSSQRPDFFDSPQQQASSSETDLTVHSQSAPPPVQQQRPRVCNVQRLAITDYVIPPNTRLAGPQVPSVHQPGGAEYGAEYFLAYVKDVGGSPYSVAVFGLGRDGLQWSGERIVGRVIDPTNSLVRISAFGNRVAYSQWTGPPYRWSETVLGKEAMNDGFLGTGDDRPFVIYHNPTSVSFTWVDVVRNAALYMSIGQTPGLVFHNFGSDFVAGTADDVGEVISTSGYSPFGTSNSKISYYSDGMNGFVLSGPGPNGRFENGGDDELYPYSAGGISYFHADLAHDASFFMTLADYLGQTIIFSLYDLQNVGGPRGRITMYPPDVASGQMVPNMLNAVRTHILDAAVDGAFVTQIGASVAGAYAVVANVSLADGSSVWVVEYRDTGSDGAFFTGDDLVRQFTYPLAQNDFYSIDVKGRVVAMDATINGQRGVYVIVVC